MQATGVGRSRPLGEVEDAMNCPQRVVARTTAVALSIKHAFLEKMVSSTGYARKARVRCSRVEFS